MLNSVEVRDEQRSIKSSWLFSLEAKLRSDCVMVSAFILDLQSGQSREKEREVTNPVVT
jgi:hypothetical protein